MKNTLMALLVAGAVAAPLAASADIVVLDFEGLGNGAAVGDYYNGAGPADKNFGVSFSEATLALVDLDAGGTGNFANEPSPNTIMFFPDANNAIMNVAAGFTTGFSFFYSSLTTASVNVYDGLNGTGNLLATLSLAAQFDNSCAGDPNGDFCNWTAVGVSFTGTARSVDFGGTADQTGFDDITLGSRTPGGGNVPEPASLALLGLGLAGLGFARRRVRPGA